MINKDYEFRYLLFCPQLNSYGYFDEFEFQCTDFNSSIKWYSFNTEDDAMKSIQGILEERTVWVEIKKVLSYTYSG